MVYSDWKRALTLVERSDRLLGGARLAEGNAVRDAERGGKRLARWKAQPPFDSSALFAQRLQQASLTEPSLLQLLGERYGASGSAATELPSWAVELRDAFNSGAAVSLPRVGFFTGQTQRTELRFLDLVRRLIDRAAGKLHKGINSLSAAQTTLAFDADTIEEMLVGLLPNRLLPPLLRTAALELNVARLQGLLAGETAEQRFESFIARLQQPQVRLDLFREYPVLGRLIVTALAHWVTVSLEFLQRLCADWPAIRAVFSPAEDPGLIVNLEGNAGDGHRGGRTVCIFQCQSGLKLVYKPRSLAADQHFQEMLGWLNERGIALPFRQLRILQREGYGWEEFVSPSPCSTREEVARFYERSGGYLALLRGLAANDFHHENVIAVGEHPVLIDLEALFHASGLEPAPKRADEFAGQSFGESVLGSGLLPVPIGGGRNGEVFDFSGLGADEGQKLPMRRPGWKNAGSDQMQFERQPAMIESSDHQPTLNGARAKPLEYLDALERGFQQVFQLLAKHRDELLAPGGLLERFARDEVRVVLRNTSRYAELLQEGSHPDVLRDALDRDRLFDRLWDEVQHRPRLAQLIPAEIDDLWRGDIPLFTTRPDSRDLWAGPDRRFKDILNESGLERARRRLRQLGPEDLQRQLWFLRSSLTTLASGARPAIRDRSVAKAEQTPAPRSREQLLAAACSIGDHLAETAYRGEGDVTWIGLTMLAEEKWVLAPLGLDLYDGVPGVGLFLAYLGTITGQERYTALARAALKTMQQRLSPDRRRKGFAEIGGFLGWGGVLYTLTHLSVLWHEPALLAEAHDLLEVLPDHIAKDKTLDIMGGAAGCIAGLLCLHACSPSQYLLQLAIQCGDHLLAQAKPMSRGVGWPQPFSRSGPLTGFSHGAAGISWALLELAAQTGENRFRTAALDGIDYERSLFSAESGNWPDLRLDNQPKPDAPETPSCTVAWCHGAPGIGLARLLCRRHLDDPLLQTEIEVALSTTLAQGFGSNHCLCHGDLGNLEPLLEAAASFDSTWATKAQQIVSGILHSIEQNGWLCGNPLAVESPGLMTGIAGIGYGLLRCAEPVSVPSVLCLAPPPSPLDRRF